MVFISRSIIVFIVIKVLILLVLSQGMAEDICETTTMEIHVTKDDYDELGRMVRSCSGEITVNKCEGVCKSQVQPSVMSPRGFLTECFCCRESFLSERLVTLTHCYDPDGLRLEDEDKAIMQVRMREPAECKCSKCGIISR